MTRQQKMCSQPWQQLGVHLTLTTTWKETLENWKVNTTYMYHAWLKEDGYWKGGLDEKEKEICAF